MFSGSFPIELWNHFKTQYERTNNRAEGYNSKLKKFMSSAKPQISKAVAFLKSEDNEASLKYFKALKPDSKKIPQNSKDLERDVKFRTTRRLFEEKKITLKIYVQEVINIHRFEPRKKYLETLTDTATSDDDDNDNDDNNI